MFRTAPRRTVAATAVLASGLLAAGTVALAAASSANAAPSSIGGTITVANQSSWRHSLQIEGLAYDRSNQQRSLRLAVYADGHYAGRVTANIASPRWARAHHIAGKHAFRASLHVLRTAHRVSVVPTGHRADAMARNIRQVKTAAGTRIVDVAKRYVGNTRYVEGGSTPKRGFDCSGYTRWAYAHALVKHLPHNAEAQRHVRGMHHISRRAARPGDLIFYFAGGPAFHVAIYAGHGMQYAAATPRDGVRYQKIWSRNIEFRTITH